MKKHLIRFVSIILISIVLFGAVAFPASAAINSSAYIWITSASLSQGSSSGKISVDYSISGMGKMDTIGVSMIEVYKTNGTKYRTIYGSTSNGLIVHDKISTTGSFEISCVAGTAYYCEVTFIAAKNGGYDTMTIQTGTVVAPTSP